MRPAATLLAFQLDCPAAPSPWHSRLRHPLACSTFLLPGGRGAPSTPRPRPQSQSRLDRLYPSPYTLVRRWNRSTITTMALACDLCIPSLALPSHCQVEEEHHHHHHHGHDHGHDHGDCAQCAAGDHVSVTLRVARRAAGSGLGCEAGAWPRRLYSARRATCECEGCLPCIACNIRLMFLPTNFRTMSTTTIMTTSMSMARRAARNALQETRWALQV